MRRLAVALILCFSLGCYVGMPISAPRPLVGTRVALQLTDAGSLAMASQVGPSIVQMEGNVAAVTDSAFVLAVRTVTNRRGVEDLWTGEQVTVPSSAVATMTERRVSTLRSVLLGLAVAAAVFGIGAAIANGGGGPGSKVGEGVPQ